MRRKVNLTLCTVVNWWKIRVSRNKVASRFVFNSIMCFLKLWIVKSHNHTVEILLNIWVKSCV